MAYLYRNSFVEWLNPYMAPLSKEYSPYVENYSIMRREVEILCGYIEIMFL
jgi:hypothetical protein